MRRDASLDFMEVKPKRTPQSSVRESRDITDPVKRAPEGAPVREIPTVEEAPRKDRKDGTQRRRETLAWESVEVVWRGHSTITWALNIPFQTGEIRVWGKPVPEMILEEGLNFNGCARRGSDFSCRRNSRRANMSGNGC